MTTISRPPDHPADRRLAAADLDFHPAAALFPLVPVDGPEFGEVVGDL